MDDETKQKILEVLNHFRVNARGIASIPVGISDLRAYAKEIYGLKQQEVATTLDYLVQHGWIDEVISQRSIARGNVIIPTTSAKYKLSALGISHFETDSKFNALNRYSGISVENVGGVVVIGNNNVVHNKYRDLYTHLDLLESMLKLTDKLSEVQKLNVAADIQTAKDQISKNEPNKSIVTMAINGVRAAAEVAGAMDMWEKASEVIQNLL